MNNKRLIYLSLIGLTITIGLFSRSSYIPNFLYPYLGDVFYALMMYWIIAWVYNSKSHYFVLIMSIAICFLIELSQLLDYHWINAIRQTTLGSLVLGSGFLWSDLICYCIGGMFGYYLDNNLIQRIKIKTGSY